MGSTPLYLLWNDKEGNNRSIGGKIMSWLMTLLGGGLSDEVESFLVQLKADKLFVDMMVEGGYWTEEECQDYLDDRYNKER